MRDDHVPDPPHDAKRQLPDLVLIRMADGGDGEAFEILLSERLRHLHLGLRDWCGLAAADASYPEVARLAIQTAVEYARHMRAEQVGFEPPDWLGRMARIVLMAWLEKAGLKAPDWEESLPVRLSHEERLRLLKEGRLVREHFDRLLVPGHREMLERVMIGGKSPEEAGREMGMGDRSDEIAPIMYRAALRELRYRIQEARKREERQAILSDPDRVWRCMDRIADAEQRQLLELMFNHSLPIEEAFADLGLDLGPGEMDRRLKDAIKELHRLMFEDWRDSQDRKIDEGG